MNFFITSRGISVLLVIFLIVFAATGCARAAPTIGLNLYTPHFGSATDMSRATQYEDATPGVYWRSESGWGVGALRNSLRRWSLHGSYTWATEDGRWALTAGAFTGYRYRVEHGAELCRPSMSAKQLAGPQSCTARVGKTSAVLLPMLAPSFAWLEAKPYLGAVPRIALLGKAVHFSLEF